jgi:hypothetical protein
MIVKGESVLFQESDFVLLQGLHRRIMFDQTVSPPFENGIMWSASNSERPAVPTNTRLQLGQM